MLATQQQSTSSQPMGRRPSTIEIATTAAATTPSNQPAAAVTIIRRQTIDSGDLSDEVE